VDREEAEVRTLAWIALLAAALASPARAEVVVYAPPPCTRDATDAAARLACHAPVFVAPDAERPHNRIGTPVARIEDGLFGDDVEIGVDPEHATLYAEAREERAGGLDLLQLVYRVHFEKIPLRLSRHFYEAHRNPGLIVLVSLDRASGTPLFVTTVHTCGCYRAVVPTAALPEVALPEGWPADRLRVYGEALPARLPAWDPRRERLVVRLVPDRHRIADLRLLAKLPEGTPRDLPLERLAGLHALRASDGTEHSFYYTGGPLKGHVKGAWNPFEGLTIFGLVSLDPTVGMDKEFGDAEHTGTPFYTMLRPWKQGASRLDRFESLLEALGFRLDRLEALEASR
jgi:hypothetical protein